MSPEPRPPVVTEVRPARRPRLRTVAVAVVITAAVAWVVLGRSSAPAFRQLGEPITGAVRWAGAVTFTEPDGRPIAWIAHGDQAQRWDLATREKIGEPALAGGDFITALTTGRLNGRPIVAGSGGGELVRLWDLTSGEEAGTFTGAGSSVALGQLDGRPTAVAGDRLGRVGVWDLAAGEQLGNTLTGHTGHVYAVAVGQLDGRTIAVSGGKDGTVRVWDLAAGEQLGAPLTGHTGDVRSVTVGRLGDRTIAVTGGHDATVRVWDLAAGEQLGNTLTGHTDRIWSVAIGRLGGETVAVSAGGGDGTVGVWGLGATGD
ncbi:hypothetical protein HII36_02890 [Nonomuraea sp. NN258]|uniref:WD40 repeat domain-containing protein n=1 Tax=Nonomuraea antri TaxID=2730852 RepID=UPI00156A1AAF|nr:hypothetical protein [Nonomuraea antri]NRQ30785.1 hypothetical protein [Nonomuraea antri]